MRQSIGGLAAYCHTADQAFDPARPSAVFIHGAQLDHSVWTFQARHFAHHGFNVLAPDLPGHGRSQGAALASVEAMADWILALLEAVQVERPLLIGHSMGSLIALQAASQAPQQTSRLALLGCAYPMRVSPALLEMAKNDEAAAIRMISQWSHSPRAPTLSALGPGFDAGANAVRLMQRIAALNPAQQVLHTDLQACHNYANGLQAAQALRCPTLFISAEDDVMTPASAVQPLLAALPQAMLVQIGHCGHDMLAEQPGQVLESLFDFAIARAQQH